MASSLRLGNEQPGTSVPYLQNHANPSRRSYTAFNPPLNTLEYFEGLCCCISFFALGQSTFITRFFSSRYRRSSSSLSKAPCVRRSRYHSVYTLFLRHLCACVSEKEHPSCRLFFVVASRRFLINAVGLVFSGFGCSHVLQLLREFDNTLYSSVGILCGAYMLLCAYWCTVQRAFAVAIPFCASILFLFVFQGLLFAWNGRADVLVVFRAIITLFFDFVCVRENIVSVDESSMNQEKNIG